MKQVEMLVCLIQNSSKKGDIVVDNFGNIAWLVFDLWSGVYSRALLDAVQLAFAVWGIVEWSKSKRP